MAMRRPRIKPQANIQLNSKRKAKTAETKNKSSESDNSLQIAHEVPTQSSIKPAIVLGHELNDNNEQEKSVISFNDDGRNCTDEEVIASNENDTNARSEDNLKNATNNASEIDTQINETQEVGGAAAEVKNSSKSGNNQKNEAFKCPPRVEYQRSVSHTSNSGVDDVFYSDIEENAMQLDLQKSPNGYPMSPSKNQVRQRIKATPIFGQRRNSFVGSSPNPHSSVSEDNQSGSIDNAGSTPRRERHNSASLSVISNSSTSSHHHHHYTPHKYLPNGVAVGGMGRMRTESGCSVFSDTNVNTHKSRRNEDHRLTLKREFEARFLNGVPDKSCLKMSDLIYYNPATNPMEQKPNLNVKNENSDSNASSEIKPFKGKLEANTDTSEESEAMPVPQLKLDSNGELILDDKSLVIETTAEQEARKVLANSSLIYLDENTGMNGFYTRQKRTRDWQASDTVKFYRCLQTVGTDFSIMVPLFPNRTRRDLKLKFKKEERINGNLINKALLYPKQFNIEDLKQQIEEEEKKREEEALRLKQLKEAAAKEVKKRKFARSSAEGTLNGRNIYNNENEQTKAKKPRSTKAKRTEAAKQINDAVEASLSEIINIGESVTERVHNELVKIKRRRKRAPNTVQKEVVTEKPESDQSAQLLKVKVFKDEPVLPHTKIEEIDYQNNENLMEGEVGIDEEAHSDRKGMHHFINNNQLQFPLTTVPTTESPVSSDSSTFVLGDGYCGENYQIVDDDDYESRTFVNLDDGSVTTVNDVNNYEISNTHQVKMQQEEESLINQPTPSPSPSPPVIHTPTQDHYTDSQQSPSQPSPPSPPPPSPPPPAAVAASYPDLINTDTCSSQASERELNESDIQQILQELAEGSLYLVSTLHPDDPDKVLNEIFMVDKDTGVLCDEPLNIPENIVQCILSVIS